MSTPSGFIALNLPDLGTSDKQSPQRFHRSVWRQWKQLARFQRSLILLILIVGGVTAVFLLYSKYSLLSASVPSKPTENLLALRPGRKLPVIEESKVSRLSLGEDQEDQNAAREELEDDKQDKPKVGEQEGGDSDNAKESVYPDDAKEALGANMKATKHRNLPPADGSLLFRGPQNDRQRAVVAAFQHAWQGYRTYAWGKDHLKPISKSHSTWFNLGLTMVDSLDTMLVMNLKDEFKEARDWVKQKLQFNINKDVNLFETTIRVLGGLLSAYHLSGDRMFLDKSVDLGDRLLGSFNTPSGIPYSDVNLKSGTGHAPKWSPDSSTSEVTTVQLEFRDLSRATGNTKYEEAVSRVSRHIHTLSKMSGLVPIFINANTGSFRKFSTITLGARGDSYYEYLLKQWVQTGLKENYLRDDFNISMEGVMNKLVKRTQPNDLLFVGEILSGGKDFKAKMDELVCFLPGTLALGVHYGMPGSHMKLAQELLYTCYLTFARQPTFLAPEISYFNTAPSSTKDFYVKANDAHYLLRPETIESLWYLYYFTGNKTYQDWGWNIFQGIETYTKVSGGYTTISNVRDTLNTRPKDMMESFFLGETLKYLYLLFADRHEIDLNKWVVNTEAHILPIFPE